MADIIDFGDNWTGEQRARETQPADDLEARRNDAGDNRSSRADQAFDTADPTDMPPLTEGPSGDIADLIQFAHPERDNGAEAEGHYDGLDTGPLVDSSSIDSFGPRARDWTNQELADLARVERLLAQAGAPVDTERGLTDEGDPWYIFLNARGEVFVHLCRLDGQYLLDSIGQGSAVRGTCFRSLLDAFTTEEGLTRQRQPAQGSALIVPLRARGNIVMHPGAALAAIVWAAFLLSEELTPQEVAIAEPSAAPPDPAAAEMQGAPESSDEAACATPVEQSTDFRGLFQDQSSYEVFCNSLKDLRDTLLRNTSVETRDAGGAVGGVSSALPLTATMGLSALAVAFGISRFGSESDDMASASSFDPTGEAETDGLDLALTDGSEAIAARLELQNGHGAVHDLHDPSSVVHAAALDEAVHDGAPSVAPEQTPDLIDVASAEPAHPEVPLPDAADEGHLTVDFDAIRDDLRLSERVDGPGADPFASAGEREGSDAIVAEVLLAEIDIAPARAVGLDDFMTSMASYTTAFANTESDEIQTLAGDLTGLLLEDTDAALFSVSTPMSPTLAMDAYSDEVRAFIDFLVAKDDIEIVAYANEVLLIDRGALAHRGEHAVARSWAYEDGGIISTVGIHSDFEAFDLIA
ncbi:MAG: hypothetical protein AAF865_06860 [Pseudomonadota bacterium]